MFLDRSGRFCRCRHSFHDRLVVGRSLCDAGADPALSRLPIRVRLFQRRRSQSTVDVGRVAAAPAVLLRNVLPDLGVSRSPGCPRACCLEARLQRSKSWLGSYSHPPSRGFCLRSFHGPSVDGKIIGVSAVETIVKVEITGKVSRHRHKREKPPILSSSKVAGGRIAGVRQQALSHTERKKK